MNIKELEQKIIEASKAYYSGNAIMSDDDFDDLIDQLRAVNLNSRVFTVGWGVTFDGDKMPHKYQTVGSLNKAREFKQIDNSLLSNVIISAKMDGISAVLYYENGRMQYALTRGNGKEGRIITNKIKKIVGDVIIPNFTGAIRGELVITNSDWDNFSRKYTEYKNSRNAVAGIINKDNVDDTIDYISFIPYNILGVESGILQRNQENQMYILGFLEKFFNRVVPCFVVNTVTENSINDFKLFYDACVEKYPCDGVVITSNRLTITNNTVVYNQMAYKFQSERKYTKVTGIDWVMSRLNKLVPTIEVEPIDLAGATVSRATAFNAQYIKDNYICVGAVVELERSGEVIPKIISVISTPDTSNNSVPTVCPVCGSPLVMDGVDLVCNSPNCANKDSKNLEVWFSTIGETDGIGTTLMLQFLDACGIKTIADVYADKSWLNTVSGGVQANKFVECARKVVFGNVDVETALVALNVPRLGKVSAGKLANDTDLCKSLFNDAVSGVISDNTYIGIVNLLGVATANTIKENMEKLGNIRYIVDRIVYHTVIADNKGKVAITGKLSMKRADFEKILVAAGYVVGDLSKDTLYLVTDNPNSGSSKNVKADKFGVKKITEAEMLALIG